MAALYTKLTQNAGVAALVGTRVYPNVLPTPATMPAIQYERVDNLYEWSLAGPDGYTDTRVQLTCHGITYSSAQAVRDAVRAALLGSTAVHGTDALIQIDLEGGPDDYDPDTKRHMAIVDALIYTKEQ